MTTTHAEHQASIPVLDDLKVLRLVHQAFECSFGIAVDLSMPPGLQNAKRSQNWVTCLRNEFHESYVNAGRTDVRAFCKECGDNKQEFGLNELLHDVCVCQVATVQSPMHGKSLAFVTKVLWQVESEFESSGNEAIKDFNKLILGSAQQKLFVGPISSNTESLLIEPAKCCSGEIYMASVEHPDRWATSPAKPRLYRFDRPHATWRVIEILLSRSGEPQH